MRPDTGGSRCGVMLGWGKGRRNAIGNWYATQGGVRPAAYQMVEYRRRNGWTHRDRLRKAHPTGRDNPEFNARYVWVAQGEAPPAADPQYDIIRAYEQAQADADHPGLVDAAFRYRPAD